MFLFRGLAPTASYLELLTSTFKAHQQSNLSGIQKTIKDNGEKIQCFLMPKPGNQVETKEFKGDFNDINKISRDHVKTFVEKLLTSKNLVPKKIDNKFVTVEVLFRFIDGYWRCINETEELCTELICIATAEISLQHLVNIKGDEYKKRLGSCTDPTQAENEESKILKEFEKAREMKLGTKKMRGSFKQQLTEPLDALFNEFHTILDYEDELKNVYIEQVQECTTLEQVEKIKNRILKKFLKMVKNFNYLKGAQEISKQRLTRQLNEVYNDFHILFDFVNQLIEEYSKHVKGCRTLKEVQAKMHIILVTIEGENLNCKKELRHHFKKRLKAVLDKVCDDFRILLNYVNQLIDKYFNLVKECRTLEDVQKSIESILVTFEGEILNCDKELRNHFKTRLNTPLDNGYNDFRILFNHVNQRKEEYSKHVEECTTLKQAGTEKKRIVETFEAENLNCDNELRDHFKQRLNVLLDKVYDNFCLYFNHVNQLKNKYSECVKQYRTLEEAQAERQRILVTFEEENLNDEKELKDHFKKRLNASLDKVYNDFCILFHHVNQLIEEYSERVKEFRTLEEAEGEWQRILKTVEENLYFETELRDHFKQRLDEVSFFHCK
ncbi:cytadherence high molecular weight protein 2-like [Zophobas morio]|uniref:cytadherence high molecular weight protein 2-like n=1 Tax=Zophobas morio TaxID=2755281 RepID=UPI0030831979